MSNAIKELLKRPIAYQPVIAKAIGSVKLTILWCQLYYWKDKTSNPDGWVYKKREDIFDETGLTRKEQETARRIGTRLGVLKCKTKGFPPIVHFKVNEERMIEIIQDYFKKNPETQSKRMFDNRELEQKYNSIFDYWNRQDIVNHSKLTDKMKTKIRSALKDYSRDKILLAIKKYQMVLKDDKFFWTYKWTLIDFLKRGLTKFLDTPIDNFKLDQDGFKKPKKRRVYFQGDIVIKRNGKQMVKQNGEWKEFCGEDKQLEVKFE